MSLPPLERDRTGARRPGAATEGARVLVVDDIAVDAAFSRAVLEGAGYAVATESLGDAVLRLVRSELVRLVVAELYIPCAEGRCVVTALKREQLRIPRLTVLVYTRHQDAADRQWALDCGGDGVLHKPSEAHVLLREVQRLDAVGEVTPARGCGAR